MSLKSLNLSNRESGFSFWCSLGLSLAAVLSLIIFSGCGGISPEAIDRGLDYRPRVGSVTWNEPIDSADTLEISIKINGSFDSGQLFFYSLNGLPESEMEASIESFELEKVNNSGNYRVLIPSSNLSAPGFEYYIQLSAGNEIIRFPSASETLNSVKIGIPELIHNPVTGSRPDQMVNFTVTVENLQFNKSDLSINLVYSRDSKFDSRLTTREVMIENPVKLLQFETSISPAEVTVGEIFYYIEARVTDSGSNTDFTVQLPETGEGSESGYYRITVADTVSLPPIAKASVDEPVYVVGQEISLDGTSSVNPDGDNSVLTYSWEQISGPDSGVLLNSNASTASFYPVAIGNYTFALTVFNGLDYSPPDQISFEVVNNEVSGEINGEERWYANFSPYYVTGEVIITAGSRLEIEPGVIVQIYPGVGITVEGILKADGGEDQSDLIKFTSSVAREKLPESLYWNTIQFSNTSLVPESVLNNVQIEYAVAGVTLLSTDNPTISNSEIKFCTTGIIADGGTGTVNQTIISDCSVDGLLAQNNSAITFSENQVENNGRNGFRVENCPIPDRIVINSNVFTSNYQGVYIDNSTALVSKNRITGSANGVWITGSISSPVIDGNNIHGSGANGIYISEVQATSVINNMIRNNGDDGILINAAGNFLAINNVFYKNGANGIEIHDTSNYQVENNLFFSNFRAGIRLVRSAGTILIRFNSFLENSYGVVTMDTVTATALTGTEINYNNNYPSQTEAYYNFETGALITAVSNPSTHIPLFALPREFNNPDTYHWYIIDGVIFKPEDTPPPGNPPYDKISQLAPYGKGGTLQNTGRHIGLSYPRGDTIY